MALLSGLPLRITESLFWWFSPSGARKETWTAESAENLNVSLKNLTVPKGGEKGSSELWQNSIPGWEPIALRMMQLKPKTWNLCSAPHIYVLGKRCVEVSVLDVTFSSLPPAYRDLFEALKFKKQKQKNQKKTKLVAWFHRYSWTCQGKCWLGIKCFLSVWSKLELHFLKLRLPSPSFKHLQMCFVKKPTGSSGGTLEQSNTLLLFYQNRVVIHTAQSKYPLWQVVAELFWYSVLGYGNMQ